MMSPSILADFFLYLHFSWVIVVILAVPLIILGRQFQWSFVTNPYFRFIHLAMIAVVVFLSVFGIECPFTTWEMHFRLVAGQTIYPTTFMSYWVSRILYQSLDTWIFTVSYIAFGVLVLALWFWAPPRR